MRNSSRDSGGTPTEGARGRRDMLQMQLDRIMRRGINQFRTGIWEMGRGIPFVISHTYQYRRGRERGVFFVERKSRKERPKADPYIG